MPLALNVKISVFCHLGRTAQWKFSRTIQSNQMFGWSLLSCDSGPTMAALRCPPCDGGPAVAASSAMATLRCQLCAAGPVVAALQFCNLQ